MYSPSDYPHPDESVLHHLVVSERMELPDALLCLRSATFDWGRESEFCLKVNVGSLVASIVGIASGVGAFSVLCIVPVIINALAGLHSWEEAKARNRERELLRNHPEILQVMHDVLQRGAPVMPLVHAYSSICGAYNGMNCDGDHPVIALGENLKYLLSHVKESHQSISEVFGLKDVAPTTSLYPHTEYTAREPHVAFNDRVLPDRAQSTPAWNGYAATVVQQPTTKGGFAGQYFPANTSQLLEALRDECPVLLKLVKSHPIRAVGVQRSGKTTLVKKLALLRMALLPNHQVTAATPHDEKGNEYPAAFKVVGIKNGRRDYKGIYAEWRSLAKRVEAGHVGCHTNIWDEFGLYDQVMSEEELTSGLTSTLRETMKYGEYPIFVIHGETKIFLPGGKGLMPVLLSSTVRVETIGEQVIGSDGLESIKPTGRFKVKWLDESEDAGTIPDWLTEDLLMSLLTPPCWDAPQEDDGLKTAKNDVDGPKDDVRRQLEDVYRREEFDLQKTSPPRSPSLPLTNSLSSPSQPADSDFYDAFLKIKSAREAESPLGKTQIIEDVLKLGGNRWDDGVFLYEEALRIYKDSWINELAKRGSSIRQIIDIVYGVGISKQSSFKKKKPEAWKAIVDDLFDRCLDIDIRGSDELFNDETPPPR